MKFRGLVVAALAVALGCARNDESAAPFVVLIGLDGASPDIIDELRSRGKLPVIDALIRDGVYGPIASLPARRIMASNPRRGYWSPILWASIATGVVPEKHGIRDFLLPVPGTSRVWMGSEDDVPYAEMTLPAIEGEGPFRLRMRAHAYRPNGPSEVGLVLNGEPLGSIELGVDESADIVEVPVEARQLRPVRNELRFELSRQSRPSEAEGTNDRRLLAARMQSLEIRDRDDRVAFALEPVFARFDLGRGFYQPESKVVEAQSAHLRARPLWQILSDRARSVGVVGWWTTWPAYPVNGFLVTSRMGLRGRRENTKTDLTWPPDLADELEPLYPSFEATAPVFDALRLNRCDPPLVEDRGAIPGVLRQDQLYVRSAERLLPRMANGLFAMYIESIDVLSHAFLGWRNGAPVREGCDPSARDAVDLTYELVDQWLGRILDALPEDAIIVVVSDHGLVPAELGGLHSPDGIFIAAGGPEGSGLRRGTTFQGASVLDVAPTVLYLMQEPIPTWMDGKLLAQIFHPESLSARPPRYQDEPMTFVPETSVSSEGDDAVQERLRSIGYIQ